MPRWLVGIVSAALLTGASTGLATIAGVVIESERSQVREELLEKQRTEDKRATEAWQREITAQLVAFRTELKEAGRDRWTGSQDATQDALAEARIMRRLDKSDERVEELTRRLAEHQSLPWHREAGAEHSETKRRVDRLEAAAKRQK